MRLRQAPLSALVLAVTVIFTGIAAEAHPAQKQSPTPASASVKSAAAVTGVANWTTYHYNNLRTGYDPNQPNFSTFAPAWTQSTITGQIYASPLVYGGAVYVATEDNYIYALNAADGTELWHKVLSTPEDSGYLPCGNISPHVGITGTPVIDPGTNRIYAVGMVSTHHYVLWGVNLTTHTLEVNHVVDPGNLDLGTAQGQRGALGLSQGVIYIPFGGRAGDCDTLQGHPYHGIVLGARRTDGAVLYRFQTDGGEKGIWAAGGESIDTSGNVYVATGNGYGATGTSDSESVFKLSPGLARLAQWIAPNQSGLDSADADVGSIIPGLIGGGDVIQSGKSGNVYLLDSSLTQHQGTRVCSNTNDASFGSPGYANSYIYIPCTDGLYARVQSGHTFSGGWSHTGINVTSPIIAGGNVIALDVDGNVMYALNPTTGATVDSIGVGSLTHFAAPATGYGKVFVPAIDELEAFNLGGCTSADMSGSPLSPQAPGGTITFTATSTGCATPEYRFFLQQPGGSWTAQGSFGGDTWAWNTSGLPTGIYGVGVWARETGSGASYEAYWLGTYTLSVTSCTNADLSTPTSPPQAAGATITFTASASRCPNPEFKFLKRDPFGSWAVARDWSSSNTWDWITTNSSVGVDQLGVWVRQAGSTAQYEAYGITSFQVVTSTAGGADCYGLTMTPSAAPPQAPGPSVTFTAATNSCPQAQFKFWLLRPGGTWQVVQGYSTDNTWAWNTTGYANGTYQVTVYSKFINRAPGSIDWDEYFNMTYRLDVGQCTAGTISAAPASPQIAGTSITFTATATDCGATRFEFWRLPPPGTTWSIVQAYGSGNTWTFNTTGASGPYRIGVWVRQNGSTAAYDSYAIVTFWVGT